MRRSSLTLLSLLAVISCFSICWPSCFIAQQGPRPDQELTGTLQAVDRPSGAGPRASNKPITLHGSKEERAINYISTNSDFSGLVVSSIHLHRLSTEPAGCQVAPAAASLG